MQNEQNIAFLYHLLRIAIGTEEASVGTVNTEGLSWQEVYNLARKQGVLAIAFDGVMRWRAIRSLQKRYLCHLNCNG